MSELTKDRRSNRLRLLAAGTTAAVALAGCGLKKSEGNEPGAIPPSPGAPSAENPGGGAAAENPATNAERALTFAKEFERLAAPQCVVTYDGLNVTVNITNAEEMENPIVAFGGHTSDGYESSQFAAGDGHTFTPRQGETVNPNNPGVAFNLPEGDYLPDPDNPNLEGAPFSALAVSVMNAEGIGALDPSGPPEEREAFHAFVRGFDSVAGICTTQ